MQDPSRGLAVTAFVLLALSLWVPWWGVSHGWAGGATYDDVGVGLWKDQVEADRSAQWVTAGCVLGTLGLLLVRLAASSWRHEPASWRRDLWIALGLAAGAVVATVGWPEGVPWFWGGRELDVGGTAIVQEAGPRIGWWCGILAALCLGWGAWAARRAARRGEASPGHAHQGAHNP